MRCAKSEWACQDEWRKYLDNKHNIFKYLILVILTWDPQVVIWVGSRDAEWVSNKICLWQIVVIKVCLMLCGCVFTKQYHIVISRAAPLKSVSRIIRRSPLSCLGLLNQAVIVGRLWWVEHAPWKKNTTMLN